MPPNGLYLDLWCYTNVQCVLCFIIIIITRGVPRQHGLMCGCNFLSIGVMIGLNESN